MRTLDLCPMLFSKSCECCRWHLRLAIRIHFLLVGYTIRRLPFAGLGHLPLIRKAQDDVLAFVECLIVHSGLSSRTSIRIVVI
jgi:hypothetical protein